MNDFMAPECRKGCIKTTQGKGGEGKQREPVKMKYIRLVGGLLFFVDTLSEKGRFLHAD
jgi:hypothetical protein